MKASIVLGLGYGDEGKGLTTDYLCSQSKKPIVIRFTGGQQAGHTVVLNGKRHVHSNFGAGTLRGIPTYFTEDTTVYPVTIMREMKALLAMGVYPDLAIHPLANLTTPFDVMANRADGDNLSHGTCGLGVGKTMKRNLESPYKLYACDLLNTDMLKEKMYMINREYYNYVPITPELELEIEDFVAAIEEIRYMIKGYEYLQEFDELIFEGSQGILLDMHHGVFPNVTFANTTSKNAHRVLDILNVDDREVFYITRCYHTRHGNGAFNETPLRLINNENETNVNNKYQKEFKVGELDYNLVNQALHFDSIYCPSTCVKNLVVTCLDQLEGHTFSYNKLGYRFSKYYESRSPESINLKLK